MAKIGVIVGMLGLAIGEAMLICIGKMDMIAG
jgi:hypothetical protein